MCYTSPPFFLRGRAFRIDFSLFGFDFCMIWFTFQVFCFHRVRFPSRHLTAAFRIVSGFEFLFSAFTWPGVRGVGFLQPKQISLGFRHSLLPHSFDDPDWIRVWI
jgi:hypothetical protein